MSLVARVETSRCLHVRHSPGILEQFLDMLIPRGFCLPVCHSLLISFLTTGIFRSVERRGAGGVVPGFRLSADDAGFP